MWELTLIVCWEKRTLGWDMTGVLRMVKEVLGFFLGGYQEQDRTDRQRFQGDRFWCDVRKNFLTKLYKVQTQQVFKSVRKASYYDSTMQQWKYMLSKVRV